ncbi:hypothetical protein [Streptomyces sp. NBC_01092]|uniref:hypothetical protein n=1 Tax=Streptomyces sp. NBC_01092 TaxID=2903748 RepID=UPI00386DA4A9|nr:hypothetical protein OG254_05130 [Streptomyces sp. NBC_01092]
MADIQLLGSYCSLPTRKVGADGKGGIDRVRMDLEARTAEWYMVECFTRYFKQRYPDSEVISEISYLDTKRFRGAMAILVKWMQAEYRNVLSRKALKKNITSQRAGGRLRSDMLGVRIEGSTMILELVEVTTVGEAADAEVEDVQHKIDTLNRYVVGEALKEMLAVQRSGLVGIGAPTQIDVRRSTWRPYWNELYYPLVPTQPATGAPGGVKFEWICYKPTFRPDGIGKDGLVLYEIHSTPLPQGVPVEVLRRVARRLRELENQHQLVLLPAMQQYWDDNAADRRELQKWLAIGLGAALIVTLVVLTWPAAVPLAVGAAEATEAAGAAAAVADVAGTAGAAADAPQLASAVRYADGASKVAQFIEKAQMALRPALAAGVAGGVAGVVGNR